MLDPELAAVTRWRVAWNGDDGSLRIWSYVLSLALPPPNESKRCRLLGVVCDCDAIVDSSSSSMSSILSHRSSLGSRDLRLLGLDEAARARAALAAALRDDEGVDGMGREGDGDGGASALPPSSRSVKPAARRCFSTSSSHAAASANRQEGAGAPNRPQLAFTLHLWK